MAIVGDLVANLTANTDGFTTPLRQAEGTVSKLARTLTGGLLGPIGMVGGALAALGTAFTVTSFVQSAREAERSSKKLDAVLTSTGGAAGVTGDEIRQLAGDLQRVTDFEDDATIGAAGVLATFTQIRGDTFKSAIVAAQDLSAVMGQDLQSSVVQVGKALNDPIKGITALTRVGVSFSEQQKQQIKQLMSVGDIAGAQAVILGELQKEFGGAAQAVSDPFTRMANVIGDIGESIGGAILPTLQAVAEMVASQVLPNIDAMQAGFTNIGTSLYQTVVPAIQQAIAIVANWRTAFELAGTSAVLSVVQLGAAMAHLFTATLPAYLEWFGNNWQNLFRDLLSFTETVFSNLGSNISSAMTEIWKYIASGGTEALAFSWTPLRDGFVATVESLPQVAERIPGELEKSLTEMVSGLQTKLATDMTATMDALQTAVNKKPITPRVEETKKKKEGEIQPTAATSGVQALQQGSSAAISAIFSSMRAQDKDAEMLAIQQQQLEIQQEQLAALKDMSASEGLDIE